MEPDNNLNHVTLDSTEEKPGKISELHRITPLSKYLAMVLFIVMPFIGGWIGYQYGAETRVVEVEKLIVQENNAPEKLDKDVNQVEIERPEPPPSQAAANADVLENCFSEIPFDEYSVERTGNKSFGAGFVVALPDSFTSRKPDATTGNEPDYIIESPTGHQAEVNFVSVGTEFLRSRNMHAPSIVFEPRSNTWWFDWFFGEKPSECSPNPTGFSKFGDPIYLTQDGDAGAVFKVLTLVSNERLNQPASGYADAVQIKLSGNGNAPNHDSYKVFEKAIMEMLYNTESAITKG